MDMKINLGGKEYVIKPNFRKRANLIKYRNKIKGAIDFSGVSEETLREIDKVLKSKKLELKKLSPDAIKFLSKQGDKTIEFAVEDVVDMVSILIEIEDKDKVEKILDEELEVCSYDEFYQKLVNSISMLFMNAKDILKEEK